MSAYMDQELAESFALSARALVNLERELQKIRSIDLDGDRDPVHNVQTSGMLLISATSGDVVGVVRMEDVWAEVNIPTFEEQAVINKVASVMINPGHYKVNADGSIVPKSPDELNKG